MVLRVPTPAIPGGNQVGNVQVAPSADTPIQRFTVPNLGENFGTFRQDDSDARNQQKLGAAVEKSGSVVNLYAKAESKRNLARYDAEAAILRSRLEEEIKAQKGQQRLDLIRGGAAQAPPGSFQAQQERLGRARGGILDRYQQGIIDLQAQFKGLFSKDDLLAVQISTKTGAQAFSVNVNQQGSEAQDQVDAELTTTMVAAATKNAIAAIGTPAEESQKLQSLSSAAAAATDPQVGTAAQIGTTDPAMIALMEQKNQAVVIGGMVDYMLANGMEEKASALVDLETNPGGHITNSASATALLTKLLPYRQEIKDRATFKSLLVNATRGSNGGPSLAWLEAKIEATVNRQDREGLKRQLSGYKTVIKARVNEKISSELKAAFAKVLEGKPVTLADLPTLMSENPVLAKLLTERGGLANLQSAVDAKNQVAWENGDGGTTRNDIVDTYMGNLADTDPKEWLSTVKNNLLKPLINLAQNEGFRKQIASVQKRVDDARSHQRVNLSQLLTDIGIMGKAGKGTRINLINKYGQTLNAAVNAIRTRALDAGLKPDYDEIKASVAAALVRVRTAEGIMPLGLTDDYHHTAAPEVTRMEGDVLDMRLEDEPSNMKFVASVFGVDVGVAAAAMESLDPELQTLRGLSERLGIDLPADPQGEATKFDDTLHALSVEYGLPSSFIDFLLGSGRQTVNGVKVRYARTSKNLTKIMKGWEKRLPPGITKKQAMQMWLRQL